MDPGSQRTLDPSSTVSPQSDKLSDPVHEGIEMIGKTISRYRIAALSLDYPCLILGTSLVPSDRAQSK